MNIVVVWCVLIVPIGVAPTERGNGAVTTYWYDPAGNRTRVDEMYETSGFDRVVEYQYDSQYRLVYERESDPVDGSTRRVVDYKLDDVGNRLTRELDDGTEYVTETYKYDERDRLTEINAEGELSKMASREVKERYYAALARQPSRYAPWVMLSFAGLLLSAALAPLGWIGLSDGNVTGDESNED